MDAVIRRMRCLLDAEGEPQMGRHLVGAFLRPHLGMQLGADGGDRRPREHMLEIRHLGRGIEFVAVVRRRRTRKRGIVGVDPLADFHCRVRGGHELHAQRLGQRFDGRHDEVVEESRHRPRELPRRQARQHGDRNVHGDAVVVGLRIVDVREAQRYLAAIGAARHPMVGIRVEIGGVGGLQPLHLRRVEIQQMRVGVMVRLPPGAQGREAGGLLRQHRVIELSEVFVVDSVDDAARAVRLLVGALDDLPVALDEGIVRETLVDVALDQSLPNEEHAGLGGVHARPLHGASLHDGQAVQQHRRGRHGGALHEVPAVEFHRLSLLS